MAVTNQLQRENSISTSELVSIDRPVEIKLEYTGSGDVPVICEVQCWGNSGGTWTKIGSPLFANRRSESSGANPKFTLDFSDILSREIGDVFKKEYTVSGVASPVWLPPNEPSATTEQLNDSANPDAQGGTYCYFYAVAWALNSSGILERSDEDAYLWNTSGNYVVPVSIVLPPSHINNSVSFSNLIYDSNVPLVINHVVHATVHAYATQSNRENYATNCPRNLRRKIHVDSAMPLGLLVYSKGSGLGFRSQVFVTLSSGGQEAGNTSLEIPTANPTSGGAFFKTYLQKVYNLGGLPASSSSWDDCEPDFSMRLVTTSAPANTKMDSLLFTLVNHPGNSSENMRVRAKIIYWINDFNCLDFLIFDGGTKISYKSTSTSYTTNKNYLSRRSTNKSTFRAQTEETVEVKSPILNKEGLDWLSEIGRSRRVFEYDLSERDFIPINVTKFKISSLDTDKGSYFADLTYIKDIISTK